MKDLRQMCGTAQSGLPACKMSSRNVSFEEDSERTLNINGG